MSDCNNNCEAVAGLHEAAANLIQYRNQINKWLNGGQGETVNIAGVNTPTLLNLAMSIKQLVGVWPDDITIKINPTTKKIYVPLKTNGGIHVGSSGLYIDSSDFLQLGGGLAKDANGNIYVDFGQMPTDKFEKLLKALRLPIWLTANMNFFVDNTHANASDTLDDGRGLSASKPFNSIQACVNYITDNYNLSTYNIYIYVKAGTTYTGPALILPEFQTNTGAIYIHSWTGTGTNQSSNRFKIHRTTPAEGSLVKNGAVCAIGGIWYVNGADADCNISQFTNNYRNAAGIVSGNGASLTLGNCAARCRFTDADTINGFPSFALTGYGALVQQNSTLTYSPGVGPHEIEFKKNSAISRNVYFYPLYSMGNMNIYGSNYENRDANMEIDAAAFEACATVTTKGSIIVSTSGTIVGQQHMNIKMKDGVEASGKRYSCTTGGNIYVNGLGPNFFPGSTAGTVDADTYSWYK